MLRRYSHWVILASTGLFLLASLGGCKKAGAAKSAGVQTIPVRVATVESRAVPYSIDAIGTVQAVRTVGIRARVDGAIETIHFNEGDAVKAGDLLISLEKARYENNLREAVAALNTARAEATQAQADLERYTALFNQQGVSKEQLMQITTAAESAAATVQAKEAAVGNANLDLEYTAIRSPIGGRTGQLLLHEGTLVRASDGNAVILTINQISPIAVAFSIPETYLDAVKQAIAAGPVPVAVHQRQSSDRAVVGSLSFIDNTVDSTTGTILMKATFQNSDGALWPGQFVAVSINLRMDAGQVVIPSVAIQIGQQGNQVFVVKADQVVELRRVAVSRTFGDASVIASGVTPGESVVVEGQFRLVPGAKVAVRAQEGAPGAPGSEKPKQP
ncbi:MAG: efflux RND transporter periplasmic adaptor subunit [Verrucomicrobiota bacterium]|nr:efflux RND transporter periplasmic adaptor subunit [Verrucomicrobiota bacterium]